MVTNRFHDFVRASYLRVKLYGRVRSRFVARICVHWSDDLDKYGNSGEDILGCVKMSTSES